MGDFGALARAGLADILRGEPVDVLSPDGNVLEQLRATLADVVVLDLDLEQSDELAHRIATDYPAVKVVACSTRHPTMRIYPAFHGGECYDDDLDAEHFTAAVKA
jgi:DNA-binding NarL/FixJ family response regulator